MCKLGKWKSGMAKIWCGESLEWWMSDFVKVWFGESLEWQKSDVVKSGMVKVWFGESECHDTTCFFICFTVATRLLCPSREFFLWFYVSCIFWKYSSDPGWLKIYQCAEFTCWIRLNYVHDIIRSHCLRGGTLKLIWNFKINLTKEEKLKQFNWPSSSASFAQNTWSFVASELLLWLYRFNSIIISIIIISIIYSSPTSSSFLWYPLNLICGVSSNLFGGTASRSCTDSVTPKLDHPWSLFRFFIFYLEILIFKILQCLPKFEHSLRCFWNDTTANHKDHHQKAPGVTVLLPALTNLLVIGLLLPLLI